MPKKQEMFKRCRLSDDARALSEYLVVQLEKVMRAECPYIGPDYIQNMESTIDRLLLVADRLDQAQVAFGWTTKEAMVSGTALGVRRAIQAVTGVWYGGRPHYGLDLQ